MHIFNYVYTSAFSARLWIGSGQDSVDCSSGNCVDNDSGRG